MVSELIGELKQVKMRKIINGWNVALGSMNFALVEGTK